MDDLRMHPPILSPMRYLSRLRHRGPDWSGYKVRTRPTNANPRCKNMCALLTPITDHPAQQQVYGKHAIAHERLAIIDPDSGSQPLVSPDGKGA